MGASPSRPRVARRWGRRGLDAGDGPPRSDPAPPPPLAPPSVLPLTRQRVLPSGGRDCADRDEFLGNGTAPHGTNYLQQFRAIEGQVRALVEVSWIAGTVVPFPLGSLKTVAIGAR